MTADELAAVLTRVARQLLADLAPAPSAAGLSPLQARILSRLTYAPQTAKTLARLCGHRYDSAFRAALSALVDAGRARHTSQGYSLP